MAWSTSPIKRLVFAKDALTLHGVDWCNCLISKDLRYRSEVCLFEPILKEKRAVLGRRAVWRPAGGLRGYCWMIITLAYRPAVPPWIQAVFVADANLGATPSPESQQFPASVSFWPDHRAVCQSGAVSSARVLLVLPHGFSRYATRTARANYSCR